MSADEKTTWGEVCQNVRFGDGLYLTCRDKVPDFSGLNYRSPELDEPKEDFTKLVRKKALPIPPPPPPEEDEADEDEGSAGMLESLIHGETGRYVLYGGAAVGVALIWWFFVRPNKQIAVSDSPQLPTTNTDPLTATIRAA